MKHISGSTADLGIVAGLTRFLTTIWIMLMGLITMIFGLFAFIIIGIPLIIYFAITKRKNIKQGYQFIKVFRQSSKAQNQQAQFRTFGRDFNGTINPNKSAQKDPNRTSFSDEEVDIDIPAK